MTITVDDMVRREVQLCLSSLVSTLANGISAMQADDLQMLCDQAQELAAPVDDWEEAALQAGWENYKDEFGANCWRKPDDSDGSKNQWAGTAESLCTEYDLLDPYQCEVFEHWAVSPWLAEKLIAQGEKVDTDFAGMNVWARTTTGQGIANDSCIEKIYAELIR